LCFFFSPTCITPSCPSPPRLTIQTLSSTKKKLS
jgi:hypothetical protein